MSWVSIIDSRARKDLKRIPKEIAKHIVDAIAAFSDNPYAGDIEKLEGEIHMWRRRIGAFRITYEVDAKEKIIRIFKIKRRTSTTYRKR